MSFNGSSLTIENSTICGNSATEHAGGIAYGGEGSTFSLTNSTVCDNDAPTAGGIGNGFEYEGFPDTGGSQITLTNTIIANNEGGDCVAFDENASFSGTANLDSDGSCPDSALVEGLADSLADNGGLTMTYALLDGSNAIDAGDPAFCPVLDQRGATRDDMCDIGAFEFGGVFAE